MRFDLAGAIPAPAAASAAPNRELKALKKACEQFEAVFAKQLLGEMRKSIQKAKLGGDDTGSEIYKDMMDQTMADSMAHQGALGIGQMLYKQFERVVGGSVLPTATIGSATGRADESAAGSAHSKESSAINRAGQSADKSAHSKNLTPQENDK